MYVVGIHDGHNASVALFKDAELLFALQEERINREKNTSGFPAASLQYLLDYCKIGMQDVEKFMLVSNNMVVEHGESTRDKMMKNRENNVGLKRMVKDSLRHTIVYDRWKAGLIKKKIARCIEHGIPKEKLEVVEHHTCHANAAYYCSHYTENDRVLIVTVDGAGDKLCATISIGENGKLKRINQIPDTASLGYIYSTTTWVMGMVPNEHEYKLMGMAPYSNEDSTGYKELKSDLENILLFKKKDDLVWERGISSTTFKISNHLEQIFRRKRFDVICGALQSYTEDLLCELIQRNLKANNISKVALGGGVFMNVKANKRIMELPELEDLFVMPSCGDETNSIGAGLEFWANLRSKKDIPHLADNFCIGPSLRDEDYKTQLDNYKDKYEITHHDNIEEVVAGLLAESKVVARVKGRMEFGARALGHRSILANPSSYKNVKLINDMIKKRDFWMPFAGSYLHETTAKYINNPKKIHAPYMILTFDTIKAEQELIEGAIHPQDRTTRPQIVTKEADADYWNLLNHFQKKTGIGVVLNTSFNLHGLPVAYNLADSMEVMEKSDLELLAFENYMIRKKK